MARGPAKAGEGSGPSLRLGALFPESLGVLWRRWPWYVAIALVFGGADEIAATFAYDIDPVGARLTWSPVNFFNAGVYLVTGAIGLGMLARVVLDDQAGIRVTWRRMFAAPWRRLPSLIVALLAMQSIAITLDLATRPHDDYLMGVIQWSVVNILGSITLTLFSGATAVAIAEGRGPLSTLQRAWSLTAGRRLPIYGLCVTWLLAVLIIPTTVLNIAINAAAYAWIADDALAGATVQVLAAISFQLLNWLYDIAAVLLYLRLSRLKDGLGPDEAGAVFD